MLKSLQNSPTGFVQIEEKQHDAHIKNVKSCSAAAFKSSPAQIRRRINRRQITSERGPGGGSGGRQKVFNNSGKFENQYIGSKVMGGADGSFGKFSGTVNYTGRRSKLVGEDYNRHRLCITTDTPQLTEHLKDRPTFFDVAKFPQATFESTENPLLQGELRTRLQVTCNCTESQSQ